MVSELTADQLDAVLAAKADAAWYLHQLTADRNLDAFIVFSSAAGILGAPGQANYAAANAVLDALARHRQHHQLPAHQPGLGVLAESTGMTGQLGRTDQARLSASGLAPISIEHGLALFDTALARRQPNVIPAPSRRGRCPDWPANRPYPRSCPH